MPLSFLEQHVSSEPPDGLIKLQMRKLSTNHFPPAPLLLTRGLTLMKMTPCNTYQRLKYPRTGDMTFWDWCISVTWA